MSALIPAPSVEYRVSFPWNYSSNDCPVKGFPGRVTNRPNPWINFMRGHVEYTIFILNEGTILHPPCNQYDMFILCEALAAGHLGTAICLKGAEWKRRRLAAAAAQEAAGTEFRAQDHVLERLETVKYLDRLLLSDDSDWPVVAGNLWKERRKWDRLSCMLVREGVDTGMYGRFYVTVV